MSLIQSVNAVNMGIEPFGMGVIGSSLTDFRIHGTALDTMRGTEDTAREVSKVTRDNLQEGRRVDNSELGKLGDNASVLLPDVHNAIIDQMAGLSVMFDKHVI